MLRTEERLAVDEEGRKENLQSVVERGSCGEQEVEDALPDLELMMTLHSLAGDIKCQNQQHHRDDKVVGNDGGDHDESEGKEEQGEHPGNLLSQFYDLTEDTIEEYHGIEAAEYLYGDGDEQGTVVACQLHQSHIQQIGNIHVGCQQWMAVDVICRIPVAQNPVSQRVEA